MDQLLSLAGNRGNNCWMAVAQAADSDACQHIEILVASVIPQAASRSLDEKCRQPIVGPHQEFVVRRFDRIVFQHFLFRWVYRKKERIIAHKAKVFGGETGASLRMGSLPDSPKYVGHDGGAHAEAA